MKSLIRVLFILSMVFVFSIFGNAQNSSQEEDKKKSKLAVQINTKYDKSKDLTTVRTKQFTISKLSQEKEIANNIPLHQMDLEIFYSYPGKEITKPVEEISLRFHAVGDNYIFLRAQQVLAALDRNDKERGRAMALGTSDYKSTPPKFNSVYEEYMVVKIPVEALSKLAKAESLELYVGPVGYQLTQEQVEAIREINTRISVTPVTQGN